VCGSPFPALMGYYPDFGLVSSTIITFVDPTDGIPAEANNISFRLDAEAFALYGYTINIAFYDINGNLISQQLYDYTGYGGVCGLPIQFPSNVHQIAITSRGFYTWIYNLNFQIAGATVNTSCKITSASFVNNAVMVQLSGPSGSSGILTVTANGTSNNYAAVTPTEPVGSGAYTISFDRPNMPKDTYTSVTANWDVSPTPLMDTFTLPNNWIVMGIIRHSQYNTPAEAICKGPSAQAWVFDSNCNFTSVQLNSKFMEQVYMNGTGKSQSYGILKYCPSSWGGICSTCAAKYPQGATSQNAFLKVASVTGACNTELVPDVSVATYPSPKTNNLFSCSDAILLVNTKSDINKAVKEADDECPACNKDFRGAQGHIDDYSPSEACSAHIGDLGKFWTADTKGESQ
jgi:hypothetical protein